MKLFVVSLLCLAVGCLSAEACDCDYHSGGCTISKLPPAGMACYCSNIGFLTCQGNDVNCVQSYNPYCKNPDYNLATCQQGGGDCGGYRCDCDYHRGGCTISVISPPYTACKCSYKGFLSCGGDIVSCKNPKNEKCKNPDKSEESCQEGGGDCGGY